MKAGAVLLWSGPRPKGSQQKFCSPVYETDPVKIRKNNLHAKPVRGVIEYAKQFDPDQWKEVYVGWG